jgi:membrane-associated phospholipid phosphatase
MLGGFTDIVASTHAFGGWHTGALASAANQLAAMPSLHIAWAAWCTLALWRITERRWVRCLAVVYPCVTAFAVLATGNHYLLDVIGGLVAMAVSVAIVRLAPVAHVTKLLRSP